MKAHVRIVALTVVLAALAARAMLPAGWMPQAGSHVLTICTMDGVRQIAVDKNGQPIKDTPAKHSEHQLCPFAGAAQLAAANTAPTILPPSLSASEQDAQAPSASPSRDPYSPRSLRGPPRFS